MHKYSESKNNSIRARAFEGNFETSVSPIGRKAEIHMFFFGRNSIGQRMGCKPLLSTSNAFKCDIPLIF